jgi:hypothetical protein
MGIPSLDVFVALVTVYIVLALAVSATTEILTRIVSLRSIGLKSGIRSILQDPGTKPLSDVATKFWDSGIIKSATDGDSSPNSLDALTFATATLSSIGMELPADTAKAKAMISASSLNNHLKEVLLGLSDRAIRRGTSLHDELAQHFDATMEKMGRWYRHWTQGISLVLAVVFTVYLNANTLDLLHELTVHPEARLELAKIQSTFTEDDKKYAAAVKAERAAKDPDDKSYDNAVDHLAETYTIVTQDTLAGSVKMPHNWRDGVRLFCGLLITILAVSLGAPFWFDILGRINPKANGTNRPDSSISIQPVAAVPPPAGKTGPDAPPGSPA